MSERLIQKASTLRKPKRSSLLSLPGGWLPSPLVFLPLASDTLCYSRVISDWPHPVTFLSIRLLSLYLHSFRFFLYRSPLLFFYVYFFIFLQDKYSLLFLSLSLSEFFYFIYSFKSSFSSFSPFYLIYFSPLCVFYPFHQIFSSFYSLLLFLFSRCNVKMKDSFLSPRSFTDQMSRTPLIHARSDTGNDA